MLTHLLFSLSTKWFPLTWAPITMFQCPSGPLGAAVWWWQKIHVCLCSLLICHRAEERVLVSKTFHQVHPVGHISLSRFCYTFKTKWFCNRWLLSSRCPNTACCIKPFLSLPDLTDFQSSKADLKSKSPILHSPQPIFIELLLNYHIYIYILLKCVF